MFLYHYYDKTIGPFKNLSDLTMEDANRVLQEIAITKPNVQKEVLIICRHEFTMKIY